MTKEEAVKMLRHAMKHNSNLFRSGLATAAETANANQELVLAINRVWGLL